MRVIARTASVAIGADHVHYKSDLALNGAVIVALALDHYARLARSRCGVRPAHRAVARLGRVEFGLARARPADGREWPEEKRRAFLDLAATIPALSGMHDLRTRTSGMHDFAQFHMSFAAETTIGVAHAVMEDIEKRLTSAFPGLELLIHPDPIGHVDQEGALPAAIAERSEI